VGPVLICDKSTIQAINRAELNALRRYYSLNIPPVLLMEILGDLKKHSDLAEGQRETRILAGKLVPACSTVNTNFRTLIRGEMSGYPLAMDGRPTVIGGKQVISTEGKRGVVFEDSEESKALNRWQQGQFSEAEELLAENWRLATQAINLEAMQQRLRGEYSSNLRLMSLDQTAAFVDDLMVWISFSIPFRCMSCGFLVVYQELNALSATQREEASE